MADLIITTQDELPGPDGGAPYVLFVNETNYGNTSSATRLGWGRDRIW